jgi:hypothetical protein
MSFGDRRGAFSRENPETKTGFVTFFSIKTKPEKERQKT